MFCLACGHSNPDDARFCNQCAAPLNNDTPADESVHVAAQQQSHATLPTPVVKNTTSVSLKAIGVRPRWYALGLVIMISCVALGALATWATTHAADEQGASSEENQVKLDDAALAHADDPMFIGSATTLPEGVDIPDDTKDAAPPAAKSAPSAFKSKAKATNTRTGSTKRRQPRTKARTSTRKLPRSLPPPTEEAQPEAPTPPKTTTPKKVPIELEQHSAQVSQTIRQRYAGDVQGCFDRVSVKDPGLRGTAVIGMTLTPLGTINRSWVVSNTTGHPELAECLAKRAKNWRLPPPPGGVFHMNIQQPFSR